MKSPYRVQKTSLFYYLFLKKEENRSLETIPEAISKFVVFFTILKRHDKNDNQLFILAVAAQQRGTKTTHFSTNPPIPDAQTHLPKHSLQQNTTFLWYIANLLLP